jgi:hypothetical protein
LRHYFDTSFHIPSKNGLKYVRHLHIKAYHLRAAMGHFQAVRSSGVCASTVMEQIALRASTVPDY